MVLHAKAVLRPDSPFKTAIDIFVALKRMGTWKAFLRLRFI